MAEQLQVLALPFLACLILTGIHAYLGIHVLSRKVIFVDIALAQIAALGATVAFLLGYDPRSEGAYWFSLAFAVLAAAIFALTRTRVERVPQEAIIGLTYAVASSTSILLADISPHGAEHLRDLMAGSIVWVTPRQVLKTGILYAAIGAFHVVFRRTFLLISLDPERAYARGVRVRLWDFLFYLSFGVVITSSVQIAGVLLVFCYLVAPAVFAVMFSDDLRTRLALGWTAGTLVSALGLLFSYDRPSGPTIMVFFALALVAGGAARGLASAGRRGRAALAACGAAAALILGLYAVAGRGPSTATPAHLHEDGSSHARDGTLGTPEEGHHEVGADVHDLRLALRDSHPSVRAQAVEKLVGKAAPGVAADLAAALDDPSAAVRENAARALGRLAEPAALPALHAAAEKAAEDEWVRLRAAESIALLGDPSGLESLIVLARAAEARLVRAAALEAIEGLGGPARGPGRPEAEGLRDAERWWEDHAGRLRFDVARMRYLPID